MHARQLHDRNSPLPVQELPPVHRSLGVLIRPMFQWVWAIHSKQPILGLTQEFCYVWVCVGGGGARSQTNISA